MFAEETAESPRSAIVCNKDDIGENEIKELTFIGEKKLIAIKQDGRIYAVGNRCSHYNAPLNKGILGVKRIRCPWHGACYNLETGDIEDFPGLDSIQSYEVEIEPSGDVRVHATAKDLRKSRWRRSNKYIEPEIEDKRTFVIIGGGVSGESCAETLRKIGFTGQIIMISREEYFPYDRCLVNKGLYKPDDEIIYRSEEFYNRIGINVMLKTTVEKVKATYKTVYLSDGNTIEYTKLFIGTGLTPIIPDLPGVELGNVLILVDLAHAKALKNALKPDSNVVFYGMGFTSMETASVIAKNVAKVTIIGRDEVPYRRVFGEEIGRRIKRFFEEKNVVFHTEKSIVNIVGNVKGEVKEVILNDDTVLPCDVLLLTCGNTLNTGFLHESGVLVNDDNSIHVDMHLQTSVPDIFAGGDIVNAPVFSRNDMKATIGHVQVAHYHGMIAARNMNDEITPLKAVPIFTTEFFDKAIRYAGYAPDYKNTYVDGDIEALMFAMYYLDEHDNVIAVATMSRQPVAVAFAELKHQAKNLHKSEIADESWFKKLYVEVDSPCQKNIFRRYI